MAKKKLKPLEPIAAMPHGSEVCNSLKFSSCGRWLASGTHNKKVNLYDLKTGKRAWQGKDHTGWVNGVGFSPDGNTLASCAWARKGNKANGPELLLWDVAKGKVTAKIDIPHDDPGDDPHDVVFSADGTHVFVPLRGMVEIESDDDDDVHQYSHIAVIDVAKKKTVRLLSNKREYGAMIAVSPDNKTLAAFVDDSYELWDYHKGKVLKTAAWKGDVTATSFSADGKLLVVADRIQKVIAIVDPKTGKAKKKIKHAEQDVGFEVKSIVYNVEKGIIAAAQNRGDVYAWDAKSGKTVGGWTAGLKLPDRVTGVALSADLSRYVNAGPKARVFELEL